MASSQQSQSLSNQDDFINMLLTGNIGSSGNMVNGVNKQGLAAYRRSLHANAFRALEVTFPTVYQLLGHQRFMGLIEPYLKYDPPSEGDWGIWGESFPEFLRRQPEFQNLGYLEDCASLDFTCHMIERAEDQTFEPATFALLEESPEHCAFIPGIALQTGTSNYPVVDIYLAHDSDEDGNDKYLQQAKNKLEQQEGQTFVLWRKGWKSQIQEISAEEKRWLDHVIRQAPLAEALNTLPDAEASFPQWLAKAIDKQWVLGAFRLNS